LHDRDKINKKTHSKQKKFHQLIKFNSSSKISLHASSCYSKNLFNITCYICNQKNYYFTDYKDEKIKNKSKESDVNWVFINLMSLDWLRQVKYLSLSRVLDSKSIKLSWNLFEKVLSQIEKLNSSTWVELRSLTQQLNSKTRFENSTRLDKILDRCK